jgi:ATP-grasp domain, R2K clade family 2
MPTLVLPPRFTPDSIALLKAGVRAGLEVERLPGWRVPDWLKGRDVVLYGEPLFAAVVAQEFDLNLLEPPFSWLAELPERFRRRSVCLTTLAEARKYGEPAFIKPADDKCFTARVYRSGSELPGTDVLPGETTVLIAEPVTWTVEFRCFVLDRAVVSLSPYLRNGSLAQAADGTWPATDAETSEALAFAAQVLGDPTIRLPPALALDVGIIEGQGWAVVEANAAWGSGIYGCDPSAVLRVVQRACVKKDHLQPEERAWLVDRAGGGS